MHTPHCWPQTSPLLHRPGHQSFLEAPQGSAGQGQSPREQEQERSEEKKASQRASECASDLSKLERKTKPSQVLRYTESLTFLQKEDSYHLLTHANRLLQSSGSNFASCLPRGK